MATVESTQSPASASQGESTDGATPIGDSTRRRHHGRVLGFARLFGIVFFGVVLPVVVLFQAYMNLNELPKAIPGQQMDVVKTFGDVKKLASESNIANDYALFAMLFAEQSNKQAIVNKQLLKVVIIQVGFAVISVGLMFIILGISDGGATVGGKGGGIEVDLKTGSTGLVTFVIGAAMAAGGALIPNEYTTVGAPDFAQVVGDTEIHTQPASASGTASAAVAPESRKDAVLTGEYGKCQKKTDTPEALVHCFMDSFRKRYGDLE
ncbi:hypothetical protein [Caballeronia novacaledonica]|uniref:Uncharacterized protein n=1 Tax=Caballeronia novacaledonica TaxID=1544861 RepID=A0AA37MQG4_9BURK|nr:hypothetical protein [Caballeronia novacaledonica]GJH26281.1 hypothetical protein CBA19CS42_17215 [Caballeronia novacaledonica]